MTGSCPTGFMDFILLSDSLKQITPLSIEMD
jgi:hypothetical protein